MSCLSCLRIFVNIASWSRPPFTVVHPFLIAGGEKPRWCGNDDQRQKMEIGDDNRGSCLYSSKKKWSLGGHHACTIIIIAFVVGKMDDQHDDM